MKEREARNMAMNMASKIFEAGRISNPEDWNEMKLEMIFAMDEAEIPEEFQEVMLDQVKKSWY